MRENRTYGSEGGEDLVLPDPYRILAIISSHRISKICYDSHGFLPQFPAIE